MRSDRKQPIGPPSCEPQYLGQHTGIQVTEETVRVYLHAHGYECLRPTWTDASQSGRASRLRGKRVRVEVLLAGTTGPEPLPVKDLLEVDLWSQLPADVPELLARLSRADLYAARMRCSLPFIRPSPAVFRRHRVGAANGSSKLQATIGRSTVLGWWTGAMGGLMAGLRQDEQLMSNASQVRAAVARSRVAGTCDDDHCRQSQDPHGSRIPARARAGLTELTDQLSLVYTPVYDPDANRIEWRCAHLTPHRHA
jgi:hypothetical protein